MLPSRSLKFCVLTVASLSFCTALLAEWQGPPPGRGPQRDTSQQQAPATGTGAISGVVSLEGSETPVRRAQMTLTGPEQRDTRVVTTNDRGQFSFVELPAGRFALTAGKSGYVDIAYGAKKAGRQGTPIQLADGQKLENANISMPRGSIVTGIVVDDAGEPSPHTQVRAFRYVTSGGERTLQQAGQDQTDDRGMYRIFQLLPGDYIVSASPRNSSVSQALAYAPVYYPGTTTPSGAATVTLATGEEKSGIDLQLQLVATARIRGRIVSPDGTAPATAQVMLQPVGERVVPEVPGMGPSMTLDADGQFTFNDVTPGQYVVNARAVMRNPANPDAQQSVPRGRGRGRGLAMQVFGRGGELAQVVWASAEVFVDGRDLTDLSLSLQSGMTITGKLAFDASSQQPPSDLSNSLVTLTSMGDVQMDIGPMPLPQMDASGLFTLVGVAPGRYSLRGNILSAPDGAAVRGWSLKSVVINGVDTMDFPLEVKANENISGAIVTFTDRTQELSGTLQDVRGRPTADYTVVLFAADKRYWVPNARRIAATRPGTDGRFTFRELPAGDYRLTAVTDVEQLEWFDPAFLQQLIGTSISVTLTDGEKKTQDIRIAGG